MNLSAVKSIAIQKENTACLPDKYQKRPLVTVMHLIYVCIYLFIYYMNAFESLHIIKQCMATTYGYSPSRAIPPTTWVRCSVNCHFQMSASVHPSKIQALAVCKVCPHDSTLLILLKFRFQLSAEWQASHWNVISLIVEFPLLPHPLPFTNRAVLNLDNSDLYDKRVTRLN